MSQAGSPHAHVTSAAGEPSLEASLMAVARGLRRGFAETIAHTGLAPHQARALRVIAREGRIRPGMLAERLRIAPRSVTEVVDVLVERSLVTREPDPDDRRAMSLSLTAAGSELVGEISELRRAHTDAVFGEVLSEDEQAMLADLLGRLADRLSP